MKRKISVEELIDKINLDNAYVFKDCIARITFNECYSNFCRSCSECPDNVKSKDDYIRKVKRGIILKKYNYIGSLFKQVYDATRYKKTSERCTSCPYCRGYDEPDSNGCTCIFLLDNYNQEEKFKVIIKSIIRGKYEKES